MRYVGAAASLINMGDDHFSEVHVPLLDLLSLTPNAESSPATCMISTIIARIKVNGRMDGWRDGLMDE